MATLYPDGAIICLPSTVTLYLNPSNDSTVLLSGDFTVTGLAYAAQTASAITNAMVFLNILCLYMIAVFGAATY